MVEFNRFNTLFLVSLAIVIGLADAFSRSPPFLKFRGHEVKNNYQYKQYWYPQTLDHFNFLYPDRQFAQRYLVSDTFYKPGGPVFFYTGNEGDIEWFCNNTGFMWDIAPEFNALLVFAEHRYYGQSLPFGKDSYKDALHLGYLSSEQALADFATLITHIKKTMPTVKDSPFISFGGSYGGMLAAWFRMKYPASVAGAISASAPILAFPEMNDCELFYKISTDDFKLAGGDICAAQIRKSWQTIVDMGATSSGRTQLQNMFKLCKPLNTINDVFNLNIWLSEAWVNLAMVDYPYPASFLEPLPGWPIKEVCKPLQVDANGVQLVANIVAAANVYANFTGQTKCLDVNQQASGSLGDQGWDFQACTEMAMPLCQDGVRDMWLPFEWDFEAFAKGCEKQWGVTTRKYWTQSEYGGFNISAASNIVFSNGKLDPWSGYGVLKSPSPSITTVFIEEGAHHLDLRSANDLDPQSVIDARNVHKQQIRKWMEEHYRLQHTS